jgi:hypothetical protein
MFTIKSTTIETTLVHIGITSLSDIWKPTYFCWSKNDVETHLNRAIDLCNDILIDENLLLSDADTKKN